MRARRRTKDEWGNTFSDQQAIGLGIPEYCAKDNIFSKTFYARKSEVNKKAAQVTGKRVKVVQHEQRAVSAIPKTIVCQGVTLNVSQAVPAKWVADVMKALAS